MENSFTLKDLVLYFLKLGAVRFGGPAALVQSMKQDLIADRKWFLEKDFNVGLALAQMAPGPLASQLAIYFGWKKSGVLGATLVILSLVLPSFILVCLLAYFYVIYQDFPWLKAVSLGASGCVMALMIKSAIQLAKGTNFKNPVQIFILTGSAVATIIFKSEVGWIFLIAGLLSWAHFHYLKNKNVNPFFFLPIAGASLLPSSAQAQSILQTISESLQWKIFQYFFEVGALVFGSGSVIIPFLYTGVVHEFHWLSEKQFLDALMVGMLTPGPIVITVAFVGFLVDGMSGAFLSCLGIFLPCFLFVVIPAPFFEKVSDKGDMQAAIDGMSTAATGAILGAAWMVAQKALQHPLTIGIFLVVLIVVLRTKKIPDPILIFGSALIGLLFTSV